MEKFKFIRIIEEHSFNFNFLLGQNGELWVGKISRNLKQSGIDFTDLDDRAVLAYRLGVEAGAYLPETKLISREEMSNTPILRLLLDSLDPETYFLKDSILVTRFEGLPLYSFFRFAVPEKMSNLKEMLENFVFNLWIGNYDKNDDSYVVNENLACFSIDYNLCGPGFHANPSLCLGGYGQSYDLDEPSDTGWAIGPALLDHVKKSSLRCEFFRPMIDRIKAIPEKKIADAFRGLRFYRHSTDKLLNEEFFDVLVDRRLKLEKSIEDWADAGYPRGARPYKTFLT